jgi:hypothetical protein
MAGDRLRTWFRLSGALVLLLGSQAGLQAQDSDENAVVGQTLTWEGNEDALSYELVIDDASGKEIVHQSLETATVNLQLKPGTYRFKVLVYNVLGQREAETFWHDLTVFRAEIPEPKTVTPDRLYLEDRVLHFKVQGTLLLEGARYKLYRQDKPEVSATAEVVSHLSNQEVVLSFRDFEFSYGDYDLTVQNPGGLKHTLKNALLVRYEKPIDVHFSVGYAPVFVLWDDWYRSTWDRGFYSLGTDARLNVVFWKKGEYQLGAELESDFWEQPGGISAATINTQYLTGGVNLVYSYLLNKQWRLNIRLGGGLMSGFFSFDYQGTPGSSWNSVDPYISASGGLSYFFTKFWFVEADVGMVNGFANQYMAGLVQPMLLTGVSF